MLNEECSLGSCKLAGFVEGSLSEGILELRPKCVYSRSTGSLAKLRFCFSGEPNCGVNPVAMMNKNNFSLIFSWVADRAADVFTF